MQCDWVPVTISLGQLPESDDDNPTIYPLTQVPDGAKEVLIYTFMTSMGEGKFQRGYYELFTSGDGKDYKQYMNVATGDNFNIVNSLNAWFPFNKDEKQLKVRLYLPESLKRQKKHIAGKLQRQDWSEVFIIGYRTWSLTVLLHFLVEHHAFDI